MNSFLLVAIGGALGSMARHGVNILSLRAFGPDFPYGTMAVNVFGSMLMGCVAGLLAYHTQWPQEARSFAAVGILGGFTTFSAFSLDLVTIYERGAYGSLELYLGLTLILSVGGLLLGLFAVRSVYS